MFLNLLRATTNPEDYDSDEKVFFSPERNLQSGAAPGVFVEPMLPAYPAEELWEEGIPYLKNPREEDTDHHHKPDMMLTEKSVDNLPWSAKQGQRKDESRLKEMCGRGEYAKVADELNLDSVPTTPAECFSAVQKQAERVDVEDEYNDWVEFSEDVNYLIKCENDPMTEEDYNRILWYLIAYQRPMLLFSSAEVTDENFLDSVEEVDAEVSVIDEFSTDEDPSNCLDRITDVLKN